MNTNALHSRFKARTFFCVLVITTSQLNSSQGPDEVLHLVYAWRKTNV